MGSEDETVYRKKEKGRTYVIIEEKTRKCVEVMEEKGKMKADEAS